MIEKLSWTGLPWNTRLKFDWYFKYRAALLQVKYPRFDVEITWGNVPSEGKSRAQLLENHISSKKGQLTKKENLLKAFINSWDSLFPYQEEVLYQKAVAKIETLRFELKELEIELSQLKN